MTPPPLHVAFAQLQSHAGDLTGNATRLLEAATQADADGADLLITGEMFLTGYPVDDLLGDQDFMTATTNTLTTLASAFPLGLTVAVGAPVPIADLPTTTRDTLATTASIDAYARTLVNALVIFRDGQRIATITKQLLPTYGVFDDARWFLPGVPSQPVTINGTRVGFAVCEDAWSNTIVDDLAARNVDLILIANASPYAERKPATRRDLITAHATRLNVPIGCVNIVGGQDEVVYDGNSFLVNPDGTLALTMPAFAPLTLTVNPFTPGRAVIVDDSDDTVLEASYTALVTALHDYVTGAGMNGVLIGLSGGLDSALAATIAVDALGAERVTGIAMPGPYSSEHSVTDAADLAHRLGVTMITLPISDTYHAEKTLLGDLLTGPGQQVADENIQARLRALHLMTLANTRGDLVLNTGNKSEASVGYFTLGGDASGGFAILKDVYKTRAYELAYWRNTHATRHGNVEPIPVNTLTKPPSAELAPGQEDTDSLPPYPILDMILRAHLEQRTPIRDIITNLTTTHPNVDAATTVPRILRMVARAEHKRRQVAPGVKITETAYGRDRRYPIINAFTATR